MRGVPSGSQPSSSTMIVEAPAAGSPLMTSATVEGDDAADHATLVGLADEAPAFDGDHVGLDHEIAGGGHLIQ